MSTHTVHLHPAGRLVALVGNPNCGKTALFNLLTGSRQRVASFAGVTVERKEGRLRLAGGRTVRVLDLPGLYSLHPRSLDERIAADVLTGRAGGEKQPDLVVCVVDATNLRRNLRLVLAVQRLGLPCAVALNMSDLAQPRGIRIEADTLARELGAPVVATVGVARDGDAALRALLADPAQWQRPTPEDGGAVDTRADHERVQAMLEELGLAAQVPDEATERIDRVVLHPVAGPLLLVAVLFRGAGVSGFAMALTRIATGEASLSGATPPPS